MNRKAIIASVLSFALISYSVIAEDTERTPPFTAAEIEMLYTANIEKRAAESLKALAIQDEAKATRVRDAIIAQYRSLRARDEAIENMFQSLSKNAPGIETNRPAILSVLSRQLHDHFLGRLAVDLTPDQIETIKDKMTYNKVKVTFDAYCQIVPKLTEAEKGKILEHLKVAREEAMDGGSAAEKAAIFQKHKDRINAMLDANGHNVAAATKEWEAKQALASQSTGQGK